MQTLLEMSSTILEHVLIVEWVEFVSSPYALMIFLERYIEHFKS